MFTALTLFAVMIPTLRDVVRVFSQIMIVIISGIIFQGYFHQVLLLYREKRVGAVSWRMHAAFLGKDTATIAFAITMGSRDGWPLMLLCGVSALTKLTILAQICWLGMGSSGGKGEKMPDDPTNISAQ